MDRHQRSNIIIGIILLLLGGWFLAVQLMPELGAWFNLQFSWPLIIVGVGVLLLFLGLVLGAPDMAVPATIVGGIGGLLYWQNSTGNWESWAYAWTLIPGFVGLGTILAGLLGGRSGGALREGGGLILTSLVLFAIFGSFLGGMNLFGAYWPVLLILLGIWLLLRPWVRRG
jgi:hypothetical protein